MKKEDWYTITSDDYVTYYIRPNYNVTNKENTAITNAMHYMHKPLYKRLRIGLKEAHLEFIKQVYFTIIFTKQKAGFYIDLPKAYQPILFSKMETVWKDTEFKEQIYPPIKEDAMIGQMCLTNHSFKSLDCSTANLYPLTNMLGIIRALEPDQEVRVTFIFQPVSEDNWKEIFKDSLAAAKKGVLVKTRKPVKEIAFDNFIALLTTGAELFCEWQQMLIDCLFSIFMGLDDSSEVKEKKKDGPKESEIRFSMKEYSEFTRYKTHAPIFKSAIFISASGPNAHANELNILSIADAFRDLELDNELELKLLDDKKKQRTIQKINDMLLHPDTSCFLSDKEVAKMIQLPQKGLQQEYNLDCIDTRESIIPAQLQNGKVRIGLASRLGIDILATFSEDINVAALAKVIIGPQNAGKTTTLKRIVKDYYLAGYSNVVIDVIEGCEVVKEVSEVIPDKDKVFIDIGNRDYIPALAYTEVSSLISEEMDVYERVRLADLIAEQIEYLIDSVATNTNDMTAPMLRYLHSACMIVFIKPKATINDLFNVLTNHKKRAEAITYAKHSRCYRLDDNIFADLEEIDKLDKKNQEVIGTRTDLIIGVINRISTLQKNRYIKDMLSVEFDPEDDFAKYIDEGKSIFIRIPQNLFPNRATRDLLATYYVTRLWLTVQLRQDNKHARLCNLVFDEVGIIENTCHFISNHVTEFRRHRLGTIFTCHYLKQFKGLLEALKSSGASYIILAGTEKENLEMLKEEIAPFTIETILNMKSHTSLNVINYGNEYARFIAKQMKK